MDNFRIIRFLSSVFTPELNITSSLRFINTINDLLGDILGDNPTVLPVPQDSPAEIPRIQCLSPDKKWNLSVSLERTNLVYFYPSISEKKVMEIEKFSSISSRFFSEYQKKLDLAVQRLALVTDRILPHQDASDCIIDKFCRNEYRQEGRPFNNVRRFEIHSLKKYDWEDFHVNSWVRIKSMDYKLIDEYEESVRVISVVNDLNTLPFSEDQERKFLPKDINRYFERIPNHLNEILSKYFTG